MAADDRLNSTSSASLARRRLMLFFFLGWVVAIGAGIYAVWWYSSMPGPLLQKVTHWPAQSGMAHSTEQPTLLMFLHPKCPCSRTSVDELATVLSRRGNFKTVIVWVQPEGAALEWGETELKKKVTALSGVEIYEDRDGREAEVFGAATSGETFLFNPDGHLLFHGGITMARGHAGDSEGRRFLFRWEEGGESGAIHTTAVYGCPLEGPCPDTSPVTESR